MAVINPKARHNYQILKTIEAGLVLTGAEVKSLRADQASLKEAFAKIIRGEIWLINAHIAPYKPAANLNYKPKRSRKLLLNKKEISHLEGKMREKGLTLVPLKIFFKGHYAKLELGLGKGLKKHDRRERLKEKITRREIARKLRGKG